jgi:hypothetical protein
MSQRAKAQRKAATRALPFTDVSKAAQLNMSNVAASNSGGLMEKQRKRAIPFAATLLCARKLIETIESNSRI